MSMTEILDEVSKLNAEERQILFQRLHELEAGEGGETPEMLAAIDEADSATHEADLSVDEIRQNVTRWANTK